eukprot:7670719-Alexandrium_andersonii.AAC.1
MEKTVVPASPKHATRACGAPLHMQPCAPGSCKAPRVRSEWWLFQPMKAERSDPFFLQGHWAGSETPDSCAGYGTCTSEAQGL